LGVRLALEEALTNALTHGRKGNPTGGLVRYHVGADRVLAEVRGDGPGFDPGAIPDPLGPEGLGRSGGRGLFLMRRYLSGVRDNGRGNMVTLYLARPAVPGQAGTR
jgi:serine/threonine-protein kinase RsbW